MREHTGLTPSARFAKEIGVINEKDELVELLESGQYPQRVEPIANFGTINQIDADAVVSGFSRVVSRPNRYAFLSNEGEQQLG
ncbi:MAG: hypothetical protein FWE16_04060 [Firmicutes bacterium]|nr:hypothetical protein [Bacillota bacterium]